MMKRVLLITALLAGALGMPLRAEETAPVDENLVVVLTDIHQGPTLWKDRKEVPKGERDKENRCAQVFDQIIALNPRPAQVILLGDIAYLTGAAADYEKAKESLDKLDAAGIEWTATLGNHDRIENFFSVFPQKRLENEPVPGRLVRVVETPKADFILLDTHQESTNSEEDHNPGGGLITDAEREFLTQKIAAYNESKKPFYVCSHHPWFEKQVALSGLLQSAESFAGYIYGHWHWAVTLTDENGITGTCFPAVGYSFGVQPLGFTKMELADGGKASLTIQAIDEKMPLHNMKRDFKPSDFTYVCTDGGNGGYEAFPDVCRLADGRLLCVFYDGWGHISLPAPDENQPNGVKSGRITGCYSSDEGKTWSEPAVMIDTPLDDRDPSICQLDDGRLLCNWFTYEPQPEGKRALCKLMLAESADGGKNWSQPRVIFDNVPTSSPIRVLSSGRLIMPTYLENDTVSCGSAAYSDDGGKTWSENIVIPNNGVSLDAETDIIERKDGTLYAVQRAQMAFSVSTDQGETWSVSEPLGFPGDAPYLIRDKNGVLIMAARYREKAQTVLRLSTDEGKTWSKPFVVDNCLGAYPSMVQLKDKSILIVYYEEVEGSSIRARRFQVQEGNLIEWRPL